MAGWICSDNETIEWEGTIKVKNNLFVQNNGIFMGRVGIGTTAPTGLLQIAGGTLDIDRQLGIRFVSGTFVRSNITSDAGNDIIFNGYSAGEIMRLDDATRNVGIGTTSPDQILDIEKNGNLAVRIFNTGVLAGQTSSIILGGVNDNRVSTIKNTIRTGGAVSDLTITPDAGATSSITILGDSGNVGVGTTTPSHLLQVAGSGAITAYGGFAVRMFLSQVASGGMVVMADRNVNGYVKPCGLADGTLGQDQPIGIIYHTTASTAISGAVWIVVSGKARVLSDGNVQCGDFIRTSDTVSGAILASTVPTVPADASHWRECGHSIETRTGAGLFDAILHFN